MLQTEVLIIGAGAAGLMCAATAAARGRKVLVLDHANKAGKKILMSGGGRCNFTNLYCEPANFLSGNPHFCKSALARFTQWDFIGLVAKHAVPYHEKKLGQLFCDHKSSDILELLLAECAESGAEIRLNTAVQSIDKAAQGFLLHTDLGEVACQSLVIATGGLSIPTLGATGFGYQVARQFGHTLLPTRAGLVPFTVTEPLLKALCTELSGTSVEDCRVSCNGQSFVENILFTHRGLSGPAILQVSSYWREGDPVEIDLAVARQRRLGQPGHAHQQRMATRENGDKRLFHHLLLTNDDLREFLPDGGLGIFQFLNSLQIGFLKFLGGSVLGSFVHVSNGSSLLT